MWATWVLCLCLLASLVTAGFNVEEAKANLIYSQLAYQPIENLTAWDCCWCVPPARRLRYITESFNVVTQTRAVVGLLTHPVEFWRHQIVVGFRGSNNLVNWLFDFDIVERSLPHKICPQAGPGVKVHSGFYYAYESVAGPVRRNVQRLLDSEDCKRGSCTLFFTGHSLGGALAQIAALDLSDLRDEPAIEWIDMMTFGMPRVGNKGFADLAVSVLGKRHYHLTNNGDPVPDLPPRAFGYHHDPTEVLERPSWFGLQRYTVCDGSGEDLKCNLRPFWRVQDHTTYLGWNMKDFCGPSNIDMEEVSRKLMEKLGKANMDLIEKEHNERKGANGTSI